MFEHLLAQTTVSGNSLHETLLNSWPLLRLFLLRLFVMLCIVAPLFGWAFLKILDMAQKAWKTDSKRQKFFVLWMLAVFLIVLAGWL